VKTSIVRIFFMLVALEDEIDIIRHFTLISINLLAKKTLNSKIINWFPNSERSLCNWNDKGKIIF